MRSLATVGPVGDSDRWDGGDALSAVSSPPPVRAFCLGPFCVTVDGQPIAAIGAGKARALFQYLVNHPNRPLDRELLIETLWPDPDAEAAGTSLRVAVHALRQVLQSTDGIERWLSVQVHSTGYQLNAPDLWLDVDEFMRCCARGRHLWGSGEVAEAGAEYTRAAALYRGAFLEGATDAWVLLRRESLKDQYLFVLERLSEAALAAGDYEGCILHSQQLLEQDRCREQTYRTLMACHARLGQRGRVRSWYELCAQTLRAELGVSPAPETTSVYLAALGGA